MNRTIRRRIVPPGSHGNVSVFVAVAMVIAMLLCSAVARLGNASAEKARANNAADAAALAAADRLALGQSPAEACATARRTAADNGARLLTCRCAGVAATKPSASVTLEIGAATAQARAEVDGERVAAP